MTLFVPKGGSACDLAQCPNRDAAGRGRLDKRAAIIGRGDLGPLVTVGRYTLHMRCAQFSSETRAV